jgi:hypothetical protein
MTEMQVNGDSACILQIQLSLRNIKGSDIISLAHPLAIISCASGTPHGSAQHWQELGRTECVLPFPH